MEDGQTFYSPSSIWGYPSPRACALGAAVLAAGWDRKRPWSAASSDPQCGEFFYAAFGFTVDYVRHAYRDFYRHDFEGALYIGATTRKRIANELEAIGL